MNVSLSPDLERFIREKVESGLYNNASEVVREALRLLVARDQGQAVSLGVLATPDAPSSRTRRGSRRDRGAASRLDQALDLLRLTYALVEQNLRRELPEASEEEIDEAIAAWKVEADWGEEAPGYLERSPQRLEKLRRGDP